MKTLLFLMATVAIAAAANPADVGIIFDDKSESESPTKGPSGLAAAQQLAQQQLAAGQAFLANGQQQLNNVQQTVQGALPAALPSAVPSLGFLNFLTGAFSQLGSRDHEAGHEAHDH